MRDVLQAENIKIGSQAGTKQAVLEEITEMLYQSGKIESKELFLKDVLKREELGFTGAGNQIAIPHGISSQVDKITVAIVKTNEEIHWTTEQDGIAEEAKKVKVIILFAVPDVQPEDGESKYIQVLKSICQKLVDKQMLQRLKEAQAADEIIEIFDQTEDERR